MSSRLTKLTVAPQFLKLAFKPVSVEQGKAVDLAVKIDQAVAFPGQAKVMLLGLPNKVTTDPVLITKDSKDMVFHIQTENASPAGDIKNLFCEVVISQNGEPITHHLGTGRLRIDKPLPPRTGPGPGKVATASALEHCGQPQPAREAQVGKQSADEPFDGSALSIPAGMNVTIAPGPWFAPGRRLRPGLRPHPEPGR